MSRAVGQSGWVSPASIIAQERPRVMWGFRARDRAHCKKGATAIVINRLFTFSANYSWITDLQPAWVPAMHARAHERLNEEVAVPNEVFIAELYLVTANMEKEIDEYLLQNGIFLDPKTRMFLANLREVMGATSRRAKRAATASRT